MSRITSANESTLAPDKCITARLWYTATMGFDKQYFCNNSANNAEQLGKFIVCNLQASDFKEQYEWLAYKLLLLLNNNCNDVRFRDRLDFIQFRYKLKLISNSTSDDVEKELIDLFKAILQIRRSETLYATDISSNTREFIESSLNSNPSSTCWLINHLLRIWPGDTALQTVYLNALRTLTKKENNIRNLGILLCILSKLNLTECKEDELINSMFSHFSQTYDCNHIALALYSRKSTKLLKEWHVFLDNKYFRSISADCFENAKKISGALLATTSYSSNEFNLQAKELCLRVVKRDVHWLIDLLEVCSKLVENGDYEMTSRILSYPRSFLWPSFLVHFLHNLPYSDSEKLYEALKFILNKCCYSHDENDEPVLANINAFLSNALKVINWILDYHYKHASTLIDSNVNIQHLLCWLQDHCILTVLKRSINIHQSNHSDLKHLLGHNESNVFTSYLYMRTALKSILKDHSNAKTNATTPLDSYYDEMKSLLNTINPLSLRLEVMENVFSMLFLRHETHFKYHKETLEEIKCSNYEKEQNSSTYEDRRVEASKHYGFVCDKFTAKQLLKHLKDCLVQVGIDYDKLLREKTSGEDLETMHKNIRAYDKSLTEAIWRIGLLTDADLTENEIIQGVDEKFSISTKLQSKCIFYGQKYESSSEEVEREKSRSDVEMSSETGSTDADASVKRKRSGKNHSSSTEGGSVKANNIINLTLASKETMLLHCLWKADYSKAQQIIEKFDLKGTNIDGHIKFSKAISNFRTDIARQQNKIDATSESFTDFQESPLLENIRRAALGGFQSSRLTNQLETFLASQEPTVRLIESDDQTGTREILTFCAMDLALTMPQSCLEIAKKYLNASARLANTPYSDYFLEIFKLVHEAGQGKSVPQILCDATVPLKFNEWKKRIKYWESLTDKIARFQKTGFLKDSTEDAAVDCAEISRGCEVFEDIVHLCGSERNYLQNVLAHLKILQSIIPKDERNQIKNGRTLLSKSIDSYLGHQIFYLNVEPSNLEVIANELGVGLVHNVLINCCPKITCNVSSPIVTNNDWGFIVLNKNSNLEKADYKIQDPNQCIIRILQELIDAIQRLHPDRSRISNKDLSDLYKANEFREILDKSNILESLDLSELSVGDHTLAFFLNLWNLMYLHLMLAIWASNPPVNSLQHFISLSCSCYIVGDLGRINLATLRSKLLGPMAWDPQFFSKSEDINDIAWQDLDLVHDPRVIFAMVSEHFETPAFRIYHPESLEKDLEEALVDYLNAYTKEKRSTSFIIDSYEDFMDMNISNADCSDLMINQSTQVKSATDFNNSENVAYRYKPFAHSIKLRYNEGEFSMKQSSNTDLTLWRSRSMRPNILSYLESNCWLLCYMVKYLHNERTLENKHRTACLENLSNSSWVVTLAALFDDNPYLASLQENLSMNDLWEYFEKCMMGNRITHCLDIINALPVKLLMRCTEIQCLRDKLLSLIVMENHSEDPEKIKKYVYQINDINILVQTILSNIKKWPVNFCHEILNHVLHHKDKHKLPWHCRLKINETLCRVTVFYKMFPYCKNGETVSKEPNWNEVLTCTERSDPVSIVQSLVDADRFELCLEWLEYQLFSPEVQALVTQDLLIGLLKNDESDLKNARTLLSAIPTKQSMNLCKEILTKLDSISAMKFVAIYMIENCEEEESLLCYKIRISVEILAQLGCHDKVNYIQLITEPLLILEQLLMNGKFEILKNILTIIIKYFDLNKAGLSIKRFDEIVRFYAGKSLDFRVSLQCDGIDSKSKGSKDSSVIDGDFIMPSTVPTKEQWVPNDKSHECDCCKVVIFSMFNRRHHCRRCGRVVCASCSQQRMQVPGYPKSVPVRVCDDCKCQTVIQSQLNGPSSVPSSIMLECWKLSMDETHNQSLREEFSFEYAPNISLCLAILNLHSDHKTYASFLLDRCDEMKRLLQPGPGGQVNLEIDHAFIIKMIRSLLVAAKVKCAKLGLNSGLAHCDRFLSHVDLIATLVQSDCLALISNEDSIDWNSYLRKLRDLLTEKEHWSLALDLSLKAGFETQGVWASWGKACLKVGDLDRARKKFSHCMEKVIFENNEDWVLLPYPESECGSRNSEESVEIHRQQNMDGSITDSAIQIKKQNVISRPIKDPPLLLEILQILENQSQLNPLQNTLKSKSNMAQDIQITLNTLKAVSQGQCSFAHNPHSREESLYYLLTYGSCSSILEFFIKHEEFDKCLEFLQENKVESELFFKSVYMKCLNGGTIDKLLISMRINDPSLLSWKKDLIYTCHSLDKKRYLHTLYHLQLFMKDYIRAAMTCIKFYKDEARNYSDLCANAFFLVDAQEHLETELNMDNLSKQKRNLGSIFRNSNNAGGLIMKMEPSEIDKHINTISRQLEIAKFLGNAEREGRLLSPLNQLMDMETDKVHTNELPTLFDNDQQKTRLAVLAILCGHDIDEGFGIAFRIMQDYNLRCQKVYSLTGHVLALEKKISSIEQLIKCCRSSGAPDSNAICDFVLVHCIKLLQTGLSGSDSDPEFKDQIDSLIRLITDVELKINSFIESKQLKAAYLLAVKHQRASDIKKISKEAERIGQNGIKAICSKWLKQTKNLT